MKEMFNELIQYYHLLFMLTWRDIRIKYKQSVMGFMWAIFMPMIIVAAGILVKNPILSGRFLYFVSRLGETDSTIQEIRLPNER